MRMYVSPGVTRTPDRQIYLVTEGGGLGPVNPALARAMARDAARAARSLQESLTFRGLSQKRQNSLIKTILGTATLQAVKDLDSTMPQDNVGTVDGQVGYTQQWENNTWQCVLGDTGVKWWAPAAADLPNACYNFGVEYADMEATPDLLWKIKWSHEAQAFHQGTSIKGFLKTGTVGEGHRTHPLPRQRIDRNRIWKTVTALNPFTVQPGTWVETRSIPEKFMKWADKLADLEEPFAEARSRQEEAPSARPGPQTQTTWSFVRSLPRKIEVKLQLPRPFKANEKKVIMGIRAGSLLSKLLNGVTESLDIWNAAYDALDPRVMPRGRTSQLQRIDTVIKNIHRIDVRKLIEGLVKNEIEDFVFGSVGGAAGRASGRAAGTRTGLTIGPAI